MKKAYEGERKAIEPYYLYTVKELVPVMAMCETRIREILGAWYGTDRKIKGSYRVLGSEIIKLYQTDAC